MAGPQVTDADLVATFIGQAEWLLSCWFGGDIGRDKGSGQ